MAGATTSGGSGSGGGGGVASMSGVIYSDDESDLSVVSDIDEGVIASEFCCLWISFNKYKCTYVRSSYRP